MRDPRKIWIIIGVGATIGAFLALYFLFLNEEEPEKEEESTAKLKPTKVDAMGVSWEETFDPTDKSPYGTYVLANLMETYFPGFEMKMRDHAIETLPILNDEPTSYIFIGPDFYPVGRQLEKFMDFIEEGNQAFIATSNLPTTLVTQSELGLCYDKIGYDFEEGETTKVNFLKDEFREKNDYDFTYYFSGEPDISFWPYLTYPIFCQDGETIEGLGENQNGDWNFYRVFHGKGVIYFHTSPIFFTNFYLRDKKLLEYTDRVFSYLDEGLVIWDTTDYRFDLQDLSSSYQYVDRLSRVEGDSIRNYDRSQGMPDDLPNEEMGYVEDDDQLLANDDQTPLQFILSQPSLKWAWFLLLGSVLLYTLFRARRRQRPIPVLEPNRNTSMQFLHTIGNLYYQQNNHRQLAQQQMKLFLAHLRNRYRLPTQLDSEELIPRIAKVAEVPEKLVKKIFEYNSAITEANAISPKLLIKFHHALETFYQKSK